jgi:hypothetical protein
MSMEVNQDISSMNNSTNINLNAFNEEIGYDMIIKDKIDVTQIRMVIRREQEIKNFVELYDMDKDYLVKKEVTETIKLIHVENQIVPTDDEKISIAGEKEKEDIKVEKTIIMMSNLRNALELSNDTQSKANTKHITVTNDMSSLQLTKGVLIESAQKNFALFIKNFGWKKLLSI